MYIEVAAVIDAAIAAAAAGVLWRYAAGTLNVGTAAEMEHIVRRARGTGVPIHCGAEALEWKWKGDKAVVADTAVSALGPRGSGQQRSESEAA